MADPVDLLARFRRSAAAAPLLAPVPNLAARAELVPEYERMPKAPRPLLEVAEELAVQEKGLEEIKRAYSAFACRGSFSYFCREGWHTVEQSTVLQWNWQHEIICAVLQAVFFDWLKQKRSPSALHYENAVKNVLFNVPPGTLKSKIASVFFPAWAWVHDPSFRIIAISVNEQAAMRDARDMRVVLTSEWYQSAFAPAWKFKADQDAVSEFGNTKGGWRLSKASGSEIVGLRGDCIRKFSKVATEFGDIDVNDLHEDFQSGRKIPRVWTLNEQTQKLELRRILATRKITGREIVTVQSAGYSLDCTRDHRIYTDGTYTSAEHVAGCHLSVLPDSYRTRSRRTSSEMHETQARKPDLRSMCETLPTGRIRTRSSDTSGQRESVLFENMRDGCVEHRQITSGTNASTARDPLFGLSDMRWTDWSESSGRTEEMRRVQECEPALCVLQETFPTTRSRVRQTRAPRADQRTVLLEELQDARVERTCDLERLPGLSDSFSSVLEKGKSTILLEEVLWNCETGSWDDQTVSEPGLSERFRNESTYPAVLFKDLCGGSTVGRISHSADYQDPVRDVLGSAESVDPRKGSLDVCDLRGTSYSSTRTSGAPHRPRCNEQRGREPDHALRELPRHAPSLARTTVLSVDDPVSRGESNKADVYDLQIEGNHNFFANGVLVHNCMIADDMNNPNEAFNDKARDEVNTLWANNQYNRLNDLQHSLRIGIQQKTHHKDWSAFVLKRDGEWSPTNGLGWLSVVISAEYDPERAFRMPPELVAALGEVAALTVLADPRRIKGETSDPVRFPKSLLDELRKQNEGTNYYQTQYLQRPSAEGGDMIRVEHFSYFSLDAGVRPEVDISDACDRPRPAGAHAGRAELVGAAVHRPGEFAFDEVIITVDCAAKETQKGSQWGLVAMARRGGRRYVLDNRTRRGNILAIFEVLKEMILLWGPSVILVEDKAAGPDLRIRLESEMNSGDLPPTAIESIKVATGKIQRLSTVLSLFRAGMVSFRDGATWLGTVAEELCSFPNFGTDDIVDSIVQCLIYWMSTEEDGGYSIVGCG